MKHTVKIGLLLVLGVAVVIGVALILMKRTTQTAQSSPAVSLTTPEMQPSPGEMSPASGLQPQQANEAVPESVRLVVRPDGQTGYRERVAAVHAINEALTAEEAQAFHGYLLVPARMDAQHRDLENWLRNEMMDKLVAQPMPTNLPAVLVAIYQDKNQDVVMRDYAIQHMNPAYERASAEDKALLRQTLWQAVNETGSSIAGTALLALNELAQSSAEFDQNEVARAALKLAGDERCGELARITAVQLCGRMGSAQAAQLVLELAQGADSIPLRITAIAALGDLGNRDTEVFLNELAAGGEDRLKPAAETALKRLKKRLGT